MKYGLLGDKLGHSYSPQIHAMLGNDSYVLFEKKAEELESFLHGNDFYGLNVTIPYKKAVIPYCNELTPIARQLGSVNTIVRQENGTLLGHNTDYYGFETLLQHSGLSVENKKVLVLGSGGASNTVVAVLENKHAIVIVISRNGINHYGNLHKHRDASIIVNTTPVGMYPNTQEAPLSLDIFEQLEGVLDLVYNPAHTALLLDAESRGLVAMNGLLMLVAQAKEAAQLFMDSVISDREIHTICHKLRMQTENILLIGMPGSGKSTVGAIVAAQLGKQFVDIDTLITEKVGCSIPQLFKDRGESVFRQLETQALNEVCKQSGLVIATGGGCVTQHENYNLLHQNGTVFCIHRNISLLATEGRPLSQTDTPEILYQQRQPLYQKFADYHVDNNHEPSVAAMEIVRIWEEMK